MLDQLADDGSLVYLDQGTFRVEQERVSWEDFTWLEFEDVSCFDLSALFMNPLGHVAVMMVDSIGMLTVLPMPTLAEG